jgi:penicillin amidase
MSTARPLVARLFGLALSFLACSALVALPACSDDDKPAPADSGPDSSSDGSADGAGADATPDGPPPPPDVRIPNLSAPVKAVYDEHGILHLGCKTDDDCVAALGYFHAANRFFFMDFARVAMRGKLGGFTFGGQLALDQDFATRHLLTTADGTPIEVDAVAKSSPETKRLLQRYSDGINAWLDDLRNNRNGAKKSTEYDFLILNRTRQIPDWTPEDTMAVAMFLVNTLGNSIEAELAAAEVAAKVTDKKLVADLLSTKPAFSEYVSSSAGQVSWQKPKDFAFAHLLKAKTAISQARRYMSSVALTRFGEGSNNWVVGPSLTKNKRALLANDPHLTLSNPAIFFPVEIDSKSDGGTGTLHVAGGSICGMPLVFNGRNESLAWGVTTAFYDLNEVYVETLNADGTAVMFEGKEVKIVEKEFTFDDAINNGTVKKTFKYVPHHGPVISYDLATKTAISVRWVPAGGLTDADAVFALMRAGKVSEVPAALSKLTSTNQNFVVIDHDGNIGWYPYSKVPKRPWASPTLPPWLPVPGDGSAEWDGFVPMADLPQGSNPPNKFFVTANNALTEASADGDPTNDGKKSLGYQSIDKYLGARAAQITQLLKDGGATHDLASMQAIQADTYSQFGAIITPALVAAASGQTLSADGQKVLKALQDWKYSCPTGLATSDPTGAKDADNAKVSEALGCTAFHVTLAKLMVAALGDEAKAAGVELPPRMRLNPIVMAIKQPAAIQSNFWDDVSTSGTTETQQQTMVKAIEEAAKALVAINPSADEWLWGRIHTLALVSPLASFGSPAYNAKAVANDGALGTVDVAAPKMFRADGFTDDKLDLIQEHGASIRLLVEAGDKTMKMSVALPGGTSLRRDSPRYNQLLDKYLKNEQVDFSFGLSNIAKPSETLEVKAK